MTRIHLSLRTPNLPETAAFYTELFGEPDKVHEDYIRFMPKDVPILLSLVPGEPAVDHLGVRVDDPAVLAQQAARLGATPNEGVVCCHAQKDELWRMDPDGRPWELYAVTNEAPAEAPTERASACCPTATPDAVPGCC